MIINLYIIFIFHKNVINLHDIFIFIFDGCHQPATNPKVATNPPPMVKF